jgi:hypothetical protein
MVAVSKSEELVKPFANGTKAKMERQHFLEPNA